MLQSVTQTYSIPKAQLPASVQPGTEATGDFKAAVASAEQPKSSLMAQPLFKYAHGKVITGEDIRRERDEALADVKGRLKRLLDDAGIKPPRKIEVTPTGPIVVESDHPQKQEIEALIQKDPTLDQEIRKVLSMSSIIHSFEEAIPFQKAYAKDPEAAVKQYAYLFDDRWTIVSSLIFDARDFYRVESERRLKPSRVALPVLY